MNIVFDFGAVLFSWQPVPLLRKHLAHRVATAEAAHELAQAMFGHEDWLGFDRGTAELPDVIARMAARLGLEEAELDAMLSPIGERMAPISETVGLLGELRARRDAGEDLRLFYLSNMPAPYARVLEERHDFIGWFDGGIFSGDVRLMKPQPEIYELLAARHGLAAGRTVFIDDMDYNVDAAKALGWHGIRFESAEGLRKALGPFIQSAGA